ncbi:hypothetical protein Bca4012_079980 [Brassica carinata]|uniref:Uncharacterized protein n=1 Tax=Brassica carinata TaxID=52824 RepID=A0A8X7TKV1_BRACI|nr:uncharacterized protein LOC111214697 [Brassica napus]XP_048627579.1 uncharacterized protein LOC106399412 [Brassica napus]KAG2245339.1 hypothetical protein Bca52824_092824 [Brassica carinata]
MDSEETATKNQKRGFSSLAMRFCTAIVFSIIGFFFLSFLLGILVILLGELWVSSSSSSASLASRCKIVSSSVDLRSSKVCGIGLLNIKAQHVFYPFERHKFRCRYDYYWASVFKVEYTDHLMGQTRLAFSEAPNEALPPECRPNFGAALLTKDNFKVNETYDCWYTLGIPKIKLYRDGFFGCQADDLSFTDIFKQYAVLFSKLLQSWLSVNGRRKYWRYDVIAGIVSGFSTSILTVFIVRILRHAKSWFPRACCSVRSQLSKVNLLVQVKRACLVVVYFSILGWMATQYLKILFPKA